MQSSNRRRGSEPGRNNALSCPGPLLAVCVLLGLTLLPLQGPATESTPTTGYAAPPGGDDHHFVGMDAGWPPQPVGVTGVKWASDAARIGDASEVDILARAERNIRRNARARSLLGKRFALVATVRRPDRGGRIEFGSVSATYFSHSRNRLVELGVSAAGVIKVLQDSVASTFQPELTPSEIAEAIELARTDFVGKGYHQVAQLQGFGILPFKTDSEHGFYADRMVYVSFHAHPDARPQFSALVDLTHQVVAEYREDEY